MKKKITETICFTAWVSIRKEERERERKKERNNTTELDISVKRGVIE